MQLPLLRRRPPPGPIVTLEGDEARAGLPEGVSASMKLAELFARLREDAPDSRGAVLPDGVKLLAPLPTGFVAVHQTPPRVYAFRWIARDSPREFGSGTTYRSVRLALPYLVVLAVFERLRGGVPQLSSRNECFFARAPVDARGLDTELCFPALLNCSRLPDDPTKPLSWICTEHLPPIEPRRRRTLDQSLRSGLQTLLHHLLESGFNRSSEHHEGSSWFTETAAARVDERVASVEAWERASAADPLFALEVAWLPTGRTLGQVLERIAGAGRRRAGVACAEDVARVILNARRRSSR
jgi:hypothetical protein